MKTNSVGKYWLRSSDQDWIVANDLDDKYSFYKKCTLSYTQNKLGQIESLRAWLLHKIRSED